MSRIIEKEKAAWRRTGRVLAAAATLLTAGTAWARAENVTIGTTAYLRQGPGSDYHPVDEAVAGREADVLGCRDGWCRIGFRGIFGYVPSSALAPPRGFGGGPQTCFVSRQAGYESGRDLRTCHATSRP